MKVKYSSNNSGGSWWLSDNDWINLEKAGWTVIWGGYYFCKDKYKLAEVPQNKKEICESREVCDGHRRCDSYGEVDRNEFWLLGALAHYAEKDFETPREAMLEFEKITCQDVSDEGCNCCGSPHRFSWDGDSASGEDCLQYIFPDKKIPKSIRESMENN